MTRASVWISLGCCIGLLGCKPSKAVVEGDVIVDGVPLGLVEVEFIPAEPMNAFLANKTFKLSERPSATFSVKSEADGTFFLKVTPGAYAVFAHGSRVSGSDSVPYTWLFWNTVDADDDERPRLVLSNDNLVYSRCSNCIPIPMELRPVEPDQAAPASAPAGESFGTVPADMQTMGSLDRQLIQKVIQRNRAQARYCYESQLNQFPNLRAKVAVKFVISPMGSVATSMIAGSTARNATLEACLTARVRTWVFPKPKGGGVVIVTYPFNFGT